MGLGGVSGISRLKQTSRRAELQVDCKSIVGSVLKAVLGVGGLAPNPMPAVLSSALDQLIKLLSRLSDYRLSADVVEHGRHASLIQMLPGSNNLIGLKLGGGVGDKALDVSSLGGKLRSGKE